MILVCIGITIRMFHVMIILWIWSMILLKVIMREENTVVKLFKFHLSMIVALCFNNLSYYKIPLHRKWVRLKCVLCSPLDALICFSTLISWEHHKNLLAYLKGFKEKRLWETIHYFFSIIPLVFESRNMLTSVTTPLYLYFIA